VTLFRRQDFGSAARAGTPPLRFGSPAPTFSRVRVALVILHADPAKGGAEGYTVNLAGALAARGHDVTLVATSFAPSAAVVRNVLLDAGGLTRRARYRGFVDSLDAHLAETSYDVVHAIAPVRRCDFYHPQAGLAAEALASGHLKYEGLRRPLDQLATRLNAKRQYVGAIEKQSLTGPRPPRLLCVSEMVKQTARDRYQLPESQLVTLFNAVDPDRFDPAKDPTAGQRERERLRIGPDKIVALIVAQDFKRKGLQPAIEGLAKVPDERLVLLVVGKPDPRAYRELAAKLGVTPRVVFAGATSDTYPAYRAADLFVLPTFHDPCSLVVLEALAMGLPTITTLQNGAHEAIAENVHGHVLPDPADADAIADRLRRMLDDAPRRRMAEACLALRPRLSYQHHLDQLEALYRSARATTEGRS
jgi:UDP-glucose:(heptosyl)LPS alpha-1,3-glucosyltransferase